MLGWSLCGHGVNDGSGDDEGEFVNSGDPIDVGINGECESVNRAEEADVWRTLPVEYRMTVGKKCKRLIDEGRACGARRLGCVAKLIEYVPTNISPENKLLMLIPESETS